MRVVSERASCVRGLYITRGTWCRIARSVWTIVPRVRYALRALRYELLCSAEISAFYESGLLESEVASFYCIGLRRDMVGYVIGRLLSQSKVIV